jgi:hypothetical protein
MAELINWPKSPITGDVYVSPNGNTWVFKNCVWVSTCCAQQPDSCNIRTTGLKVGIVFPSGEGDYLSFPLAFIFSIPYIGEDVWRLELIDSSSFVILEVRAYNGGWGLFITSEEGDEEILAVSEAGEPLGSWTVEGENIPEGAEIVSECGYDSPICLRVKIDPDAPYVEIVTLSPVRSYSPGSGSLSGAIQAYTLFDNFISIVPIGSTWYAWDADLGVIIGELTGVTVPNLPVGGTWIGTEPATVTTEEGVCPCDIYVSGISSLLNAENDQATFTLGFNFSYSGTGASGDIFTNGIDISNQIYATGASSWGYDLGVNVATLSSTEPLGIWNMTGATAEDVIFTGFTTTCGAIEWYESCLSFEGPSGPYASSLVYFEIGGTSGYTDFEGVLVSPIDSTTWVIIDDSTGDDVAYATAPFDEPPFGLVWTPEPGYSNVSFEIGFCPS